MRTELGKYNAGTPGEVRFFIETLADGGQLMSTEG